ncbi:MAG: hypothetical protein MK193_14455 [Lentisphaeria bacterium]|nr:hypothetical protein [Lentisphaeria bacterium]
MKILYICCVLIVTICKAEEKSLPLSVELQTEKEFVISKDNFGFNNNLIYRPFHANDPRFMEKYVELGKPYYRYPGGTTANYFNALTGEIIVDYNGIKVGKKFQHLNALLLERFGEKRKELTPFSDFIKKTGADWIYVANLASMSPQQNHELFLKMKARGIEPSRIELGNEVYFPNYKAYMPNYPKQAKELAAIAKKVFPKVKLGVVVPSLYYTNKIYLDKGLPKDDAGKNNWINYQLQWTRAIAKENFYDAIIVHLYTHMGMRYDTKLKDMVSYEQAYLNGLSHLDGKLQDALTQYKETFPGKKVWVTEYNMNQFGKGDFRQYKGTITFIGNLVGMSMMPRLIADQEITVTTYHSIIHFFKWEGEFSSKTKFTMHRKFEAMKLMGKMILGAETYVPSKIFGAKTYQGDGGFTGKYSEVDAHFFRNGNKGTLFVYNKFATNYTVNELQLDTGELAIVTGGTVYDPPAGQKIEDSIMSLDAKEYSLTPIAGGPHKLPPYSFSFIEYNIKKQ